MNVVQITGNNSNLDRRQKKTRLAIENALLDLMQSKPLNAISISELAEHADVNRKTFYNHYESIEQVLEGINQKVLDIILDALPEKITINNEIEIYHLLLDLTKQLEPHKKILRQVSRTSNNFSFIEYFKDQLLPYFERNLLSYHIDPAFSPFMNSFIFSGVSSMYYEWLDNDALDANAISLLCYNLICSSIRLDNYKDITLSF